MKAPAWYKAGRQAPASPHFRGRCHSRDQATVVVLVKDVTTGKANGRHFRKRCHGQGEVVIVIFRERCHANTIRPILIISKRCHSLRVAHAINIAGDVTALRAKIRHSSVKMSQPSASTKSSLSQKMSQAA